VVVAKAVSSPWAFAPDIWRLVSGTCRLFHYNLIMSFCEHCEGQRFDRARVLRALRQVRKDLRAARQGTKCDAALVTAMNAIRDLDIPHLEWEPDEDAVIH
jgi:hypothetical protein